MFAQGQYWLTSDEPGARSPSRWGESGEDDVVNPSKASSLNLPITKPAPGAHPRQGLFNGHQLASSSFCLSLVTKTSSDSIN
jgi:hypothetical protein